ncbi:hypothetical protein [Bradyrhizobium sp. SZCCHNRI3016]|uniref:hypothetical protein n=1 Tax=Bradyrhizobium sp. SZCCHNRI3016 TaxID=3057288 RepID=UPI002915D7BF|nr:hypothetical protein [Bradyrhizobium sp. SZCCHNRI3016]
MRIYVAASASLQGLTEQDIRKLDNIIVQARVIARRTAKPEAGCNPNESSEGLDEVSYVRLVWGKAVAFP